MGLKVVLVTGICVTRSQLVTILGMKRWNEKVATGKIKAYNDNNELLQIHRLYFEIPDCGFLIPNADHVLVIGMTGAHSDKEMLRTSLLNSLPQLQDKSVNIEIYAGICKDCSK